MRSPLLKTAIALSAGLAMTAGARADEACTEMQVFLSISPNHRANVMAEIAPVVKEKHGVDIVAEEVGSAVMLERLSAQADAPRVTIAHWDAPVGVAGCERGLCAPIDFAKAPNLSNLYDWAITRNAAGEPDVLASTVVVAGLLYNEEIFESEGLAPPTSWDDLQREDLKGRVSITSPVSTWGTAELVMYARENGGGEKDIDPGFAFVQETLPAVHTVHTWSSELANLMQLGEVWLGTTGSNMGPALRAKGLPVRWIGPEEGAPFVNGGLSLIKGAPCMEAAYTYLDAYYSDAFQVLRMKEGGVSSPVRTAWEAAPQEVLDAADAKGADFDGFVNLDWGVINAERPGWIERWQREVR